MALGVRHARVEAHERPVALLLSQSGVATPPEGLWPLCAGRCHVRVFRPVCESGVMLFPQRARQRRILTTDYGIVKESERSVTSRLISLTHWPVRRVRNRVPL